MGTIRIKKKVDLLIKPLEAIGSAAEWIDRVIELREAHPFPWEHQVVTGYNQKTGSPCRWKWEDYGAEKWEMIHTHHGFYTTLPKSKAVHKALAKIAEDGVPIVVGRYVLFPWKGSYNGETVTEGLKMMLFKEGLT